MSTNLTPEIAALPIYQAGYLIGVDVGLRLALDAICAELTREDDLAAVARVTTEPSTIEEKLHTYAAGRLQAVAAIVAGTFRQVAS
jgi:hypothetical protein